MSDSAEKSYRDMLHRALKGIVFFGVPNQGMNISSLLPMVGSNANLHLLSTLGDKFNATFLHSPFLQDQAQRFQAILDHAPHHHPFPQTRATSLVSFYETKLSPTAVEGADGQWRMAGPPAVLVSKESATHGRPSGHDVVPVDKTHSELVKFDGPGDAVYALVLHQLVGMRRRGAWDRLHDRARRALWRAGKFSFWSSRVMGYFFFADASVCVCRDDLVLVRFCCGGDALAGRFWEHAVWCGVETIQAGEAAGAAGAATRTDMAGYGPSEIAGLCPGAYHRDLGRWDAVDMSALLSSLAVFEGDGLSG